MHVLEQRPRPRLRPFVERVMIVQHAGNHRDCHLPDVRPVAAFSLHGRVRIDGRWAPATAFTGVRETLRAHEHCDDHAVLLVTFTPLGASAFQPPPLDAFTGTTTELTEAIGSAADLQGLHEQLATVDSHARRFDLIETFLLARLRAAELDPLMSAAVAWLRRDAGPKRIGELTRHIGLSQSALERRFRRFVGITPKRFASIVRLRRAVALRRSGHDLTVAAHAAGYFDQSHLIHDFRRATGRSPEAFFRERSM